MPVVISHSIRELRPRFFWMGGGHPDIKLRVSFEEFGKVCDSDILV
jgi:hypothetical protein